MFNSAKGRVYAEFNSFELRGDDNDFSGDRWRLDFVTARNGGLAFHCGTNDRYVGLELFVHDTRPTVDHLSNWERAVEFSFTFTDPPYLAGPLGQTSLVDIALQDLHIDKGPTRIRAFTRGRIEASDENYRTSTPVAVDEPTNSDALTEQFRIEMWPASADARNDQPLIIKGEER